MLSLKSLTLLTVTLLVMLAFICIKGSKVDILWLYPGYSSPSYKYTHSYGYKRGLPIDKISMSFLKPANAWHRNEDTEDFDKASIHLYKMLQDYLGRDRSLGSMNKYNIETPKFDIVRRKRSAVATNAETRLDKTKIEGLDEQKDSLDVHSKENSNETNVDDFNIQDAKENAYRYIETLPSDTIKMNIDPLSNGFQRKPNKSDILNQDVSNNNEKCTEMNYEDEFVDKRAFDRLSSSFIKRVEYEANKRSFDKIKSGFVKKDNDDNNIELQEGNNYEKRYFDRKFLGFLKKVTDEKQAWIKRHFNRLSTGFVKKDDGNSIQDTNGKNMRADIVQTAGSDRVLSGRKNSSKDKDDHSFDNISSKYKSNNYAEASKRGFDRVSSGFVKKGDDNEENKRGLDRLSSGFVKRRKNHLQNNSKFLPSYHVFAKNDYEVAEDKRGLDRISSAFVKRPFDRLSSGFVKRPDDIYDDLRKEHDAEKQYLRIV